MSALVVVTGTGTGIGKTHFAEALLLAASRIRPGGALGYKPVESGVRRTDDPASDAARLAAASFHVKHSAYRFSPPISPHLAARADGVRIDLSRIEREVRRLAGLARLLVVELPGGLFSPLTDHATNADLLARLPPRTTLLVAPDRLGVLHELTATRLAATTLALRLDAAILVAPETRDSSTGRNAAEIPRTARLRVALTLPRAPAPALARRPALVALARSLLQKN